MRFPQLPGMVLLLSAIGSPVPAAEPGCEAPGDGRIPSIALAPFAEGLEQPVHLTHAGDGSRTLYVVEQAGTIRALDGTSGEIASEPFLDIRDRVVSGGEKGLLSVAFHPDYGDNGYFFVDYTTRRDGLRTVVSRFRRDAKGGVDPAGEEVLLEIEQPFGNHNGGQLAFGPDGYLYIGMGDGGLANDPFEHGQNPGTLLGALLRIDTDRRQGGRAYAIPGDNPFAGEEGARAEIYAYGLRNPWRFSFDPATGRLFAADVGQDAVEEIDVVTRGGNYGWDLMEGDICNIGPPEDCRGRGLTAPIATYDHSQGFSVTGGFVYRGRRIPGLCGVYLYADYGSRRIWGLRYAADSGVTAQRELMQVPLNVSSFGRDTDGELYLLGHRSGRIMRITAERSE